MAGHAPQGRSGADGTRMPGKGLRRKDCGGRGVVWAKATGVGGRATPMEAECGERPPCPAPFLPPHRRQRLPGRPAVPRCGLSSSLKALPRLLFTSPVSGFVVDELGFAPKPSGIYG